MKPYVPETFPISQLVSQVSYTSHLLGELTTYVQMY